MARSLLGLYPRLVSIPSHDTAFADAVQSVIATQPWIDDPDSFSDALRPFFPDVLVRRRELDGEDRQTWYVYRDGRYP
jgi:hypothetical protein